MTTEKEIEESFLEYAENLDIIDLMQYNRDFDHLNFKRDSLYVDSNNESLGNFLALQHKRGCLNYTLFYFEKERLNIESLKEYAGKNQNLDDEDLWKNFLEEIYCCAEFEINSADCDAEGIKITDLTIDYIEPDIDDATKNQIESELMYDLNCMICESTHRAVIDLAGQSAAEDLRDGLESDVEKFLDDPDQENFSNLEARFERIKSVEERCDAFDSAIHDNLDIDSRVWKTAEAIIEASELKKLY